MHLCNKIIKYLTILILHKMINTVPKKIEFDGLSEAEIFVAGFFARPGSSL